MISLVFSKVGHRRSRQMRLRHILSDRHDNTPFDAADARRPDYSHPADSIPPFEAGQPLSNPAHATGAPVESGACDWSLSKPADSSAGVGATSTGEENGARTPRSAAASPTRLCFFSLLFSHFSSQLQLEPLFLKSYSFDSESIC
jgi:hypothetical protein